MRMKITQETAQTWLDATKVNRKVSPQSVRVYASDMKKGRWRSDLAPAIMINRAGAVIDGQHRLHALLSLPEGSELDSEVRLIDDPKAIEVVDTGKPRSLKDTLVIRGFDPIRAVQMSSFLSTSSAWGVNQHPGNVLSRSRQVEWLETNPNTEKAAEFAYTMNASRRRIVRIPTGVSSTLYDVASFGHGSDTVVEFVTELQMGMHNSDVLSRTTRLLLDAQNPRRKGSLTPVATGYIVARAYNGWVLGENPRRLYARRSVLPEIPGYVEWQEERWHKFLEEVETPDDVQWATADGA